MTKLAFTTAPSQASHYLKALLAPKRGLRAGETLPPIEATLELAPSALALATYRRVCGFDATGVPITFPHVLASPLHLALVTAREFPLRAMGLLHVANQLTQHRELRAGERLSLRVAIAGQRDARRGLEFDLRTEVSIDGALVWESISTLLHRVASQESPRASSAAPSALAPMERGVEWKLDANLGRRYARVSGDFNPIHLWPITARLFGFRRPIIHGMWTLARAAAALAPHSPTTPSRLDVRFKRPLALPGTALFGASTLDGGQIFRVADRAGREIFLEGSWHPRQRRAD